MLGVQPLRGRLFQAEEHENGKANVVVLSHGAWQQRFGGDEVIIGTTITLEGQPFLIAGVLPPAFHADLMSRSPAPGERADLYELWIPQVVQPQERELRNSRFWSVVGRLAPGATLDQAQAELTAISSQMAIEYPRSPPPRRPRSCRYATTSLGRFAIR